MYVLRYSTVLLAVTLSNAVYASHIELSESYGRNNVEDAAAWRWEASRVVQSRPESSNAVEGCGGANSLISEVSEVSM
jgi:hypothetical protein